jgi:hypothetical protein
VEDFVDRQCRHQLPLPGHTHHRRSGQRRTHGLLETRSGTYVLRGKVGYDQNTWTGRFEKPNDQTDFPIKGQFQLMTRDSGKITGSYQPTGTAIGFTVTGTR